MLPQDQHTFQQIRERLVESGLKATQQRIVILGALQQMQNHPTAEQLYECVKPQNPSLSYGTIYKTLDTLVATGLVAKVASPEGTMRYDAKQEAHHHLYCDNTQDIIDFQDEELEGVLKEYFAKKNIKNFSIRDIRLLISGTKENPGQDVVIE